MRLFQRQREDGGPRVPLPSGEDLMRIGRAAYGGESPVPPGPAALSTAELDGYVMRVMESTGWVSPGTPAWTPISRAFLEGLVSVASRSGDWAYVGAMIVAANFVTDGDRSHASHLAILDHALLTLRDDGVAFTALAPYALERWQAVHGYDGIFPAAWPRSLENVPVPAPGEEPPVDDLAEGEGRRLAQPYQGDASNVIYGERRADGRYVAVIDGIDVADGVRKRWEWPGLAGGDYVAFLRELGDRIATPPHWAHPDLAPFFPARARTRQEMRDIARRQVRPPAPMER